MKYLVVAKHNELNLPWAQALLAEYEPIITGVGGANVIAALKDLPRDSKVFNVGYVGSTSFPVGSSHFISDVRLWHPNVTFHETTYHLSDVDITPKVCVTAGDFLLDGEGLPENSVVDMELAYIAAFGFASLTAVKYVSDKLDYHQYEKNAK